MSADATGPFRMEGGQHLSQVKDLISKLKSYLKSKGVTYLDVAERLGVAESTVKRWFATGSFDIERLDDFANMLNIDIGDLLSSSKKRIMQKCFTEEQELELSCNEGLFSVLYLALTGLSYHSMLENFELSGAKLRSFLLRLDHLGLIELHPDDRIVALVKTNTRWLPYGPLSQKYGKQLRQDFMTTEFADPREVFWLISGKASDATMQVFGRKFEVLLNELQELMDFDQDLPDSEAPFTTLFSAHRPWKMPIAQLKRKKKA